MEKLLTPEEIAKYLGVKMATIYKWTHEEFIPFIKLGRLIRFRESDVLEWLEKRKNPGRKIRRLNSNGFLK